LSQATCLRLPCHCDYQCADSEEGPRRRTFAKDSWDSELRTFAARCLVVPVTVGDSEAEVDSELKSESNPSQHAHCTLTGKFRVKLLGWRAGLKGQPQIVFCSK
jgi:hypothetical protein